MTFYFIRANHSKVRLEYQSAREWIRIVYVEKCNVTNPVCYVVHGKGRYDSENKVQFMNPGNVIKWNVTYFPVNPKNGFRFDVDLQEKIVKLEAQDFL